MRCPGLCAIVVTVALHGLALAKPETGQSTSETPLGDVMKPSTLTMHSYGLCNTPQNADAFPRRPVTLVAGVALAEGVVAQRVIQIEEHQLRLRRIHGRVRADGRPEAVP